METRSAVIILLFLTVVASGCANTPGGNGSDPETSPEKGQAITIHRLSVSPQEVYEDTSVRISLDIANTGNLPAEVKVGEQGEGVLKDYCVDQFGIEDFQITVAGRDGGEFTEKPGTLKPGREMKIRWTLKQEGRVPLYGQKCEMDFSMPFNYSVDAYRQVQIKDSREIENAELRSESSTGPLVFAIETIGSSTESSSVFVKGEDAMTIMLQLQNHGAEGYRKGVVDINEKSLWIDATDPIPLDEGFQVESGERVWKPKDGKCEVGDVEKDIKLFEGRSRVISCNIDVREGLENWEAPSMISEIRSQVNYTYVKDVGSRTVRVKTRGN